MTRGRTARYPDQERGRCLLAKPSPNILPHMPAQKTTPAQIANRKASIPKPAKGDKSQFLPGRPRRPRDSAEESTKKARKSTQSQPKEPMKAHIPASPIQMNREASTSARILRAKRTQNTFRVATRGSPACNRTPPESACKRADMSPPFISVYQTPAP